MGALVVGASEDQVGSKLGLLPNLKDGLVESLVVGLYAGLRVSSKVDHGAVRLYVGFIVGSLLVGSLVISPRRSSSSRGISIAPIDMLISLSLTGVDNSRTSIDMLKKSVVSVYIDKLISLSIACRDISTIPIDRLNCSIIAVTGVLVGFGLGASLLGSSVVVRDDVGFDKGLIVGDKLGDAVTGFKVGLSLGITEIGFGDVVFVVGVNVGSLLVGDTEVGESLGFGLGASLLGCSIVGEDVGLNEGFRVVGLKVADVLVGI